MNQTLEKNKAVHLAFENCKQSRTREPNSLAVPLKPTSFCRPCSVHPTTISQKDSAHEKIKSEILQDDVIFHSFQNKESRE
jgi:hypothetical protein